MAMTPGFVPPPKGDLHHLARLGRFLLPYRWRVAGALVALVVAASCVLALGQGLRHVVDRGFGSGDPNLLNAALAAVVALSVLLACATWVRFYLMMSVGERVIADLRNAVFAHVLTLSPAFFDSSRTGEIGSRLTNDTEQIRQVIGFGFSMLLRNGLMMLGALVLLFLTSPKLAAFIVLGVPATVVPILLLGRHVRRLARVNQDRVADVSSHVDESLHEIRTVQAYRHEARTLEQFSSAVEAAYVAGVHRVRVKAWLISSVLLIGFCAVGVILWVGGHDVFAGRLTAGELSAFVFYAFVVATGAGTISEVWGELQRAAGATERLMEILDTKPQITAPALPAPRPVHTEIAFDSVTVAYPARPGTPALDRFSLRLSQGERLALVGPSGAGKTTVLALLLRFYDPQQGSVRVGNTDLREFDPSALRRLIAVVPQDPV